jgi:multidrug resistance efflux pump
VLLGAAGTAIAAYVLSDTWGGESRGVAGQKPDLIPAERQTFEITTTATGELAAARQIELRNQLEQPTTITEIIREGTQVNAGEVLVRLNADNIQQQIDEEMLRVAEARADLTVAENAYQIQLTENESSLRATEVALALAELELRKWREGEVVSRRQSLDLALEKATRERERLKEKYEQSIALQAQGFLSRDELKRDELALLEAEAALQTATLNRSVYEEFEYPRDEKTRLSDVDKAVAELEKVRRQNDSNLASREATLANRRQQLALREARLDKLREQRDLATIRAPSDGLVVYATSLNRDRWGNANDGTLDIGRTVQRNTPLIILPDVSDMVASVRVHESLLGRIQRGQRATVRIDALGGRSVPGVISDIGVIAESGGFRDPNLREYTVRISLDLGEIRGAVKPSMRAEATIYLDRVVDALAVPVQSIFSDSGVNYVLVPDRDRFRRVPVRVGRRSDRLAEVLAGLDAGTRVLIREPRANEVLTTPWDSQALAAVGLRMNDNGRAVPLQSGPRGPAGNGTPAQPPSEAGAEPGRRQRPPAASL